MRNSGVKHGYVRLFLSFPVGIYFIEPVLCQNVLLWRVLQLEVYKHIPLHVILEETVEDQERSVLEQGPHPCWVLNYGNPAHQDGLPRPMAIETAAWKKIQFFMNWSWFMYNYLGFCLVEKGQTCWQGCHSRRPLMSFFSRGQIPWRETCLLWGLFASCLF